MKIPILIGSSALSIFLLAGCTGNDESNGKADNSEGQTDPVIANEKEKPAFTQEEVMEAIKKQINTKLTIHLPEKIPLNEGEHLTAATESTDDHYTVIFFSSDDAIPINDKKLNDPNEARQIARLTVHEYSNKEQAGNEVAFEDFSKNGGQEDDLGFGLTGYQDAGAGSLWTGWNEGRWALATHTHTDQADNGVKLAKEAVAFLEEHSLPIPRENGFVHLDAIGADQRIVWQKETIVYRLDQISDPIVALQIAVSSE